MASISMLWIDSVVQDFKYVSAFVVWRVTWLNWTAVCPGLCLGSLSNSGMDDISELCEVLKTNTVVKQLKYALYLYR